MVGMVQFHFRFNIYFVGSLQIEQVHGTQYYTQANIACKHFIQIIVCRVHSEHMDGFRAKTYG